MRNKYWLISRVLNIQSNSPCFVIVELLNASLRCFKIKAFQGREAKQLESFCECQTKKQTVEFALNQ